MAKQLAFGRLRSDGQGKPGSCDAKYRHGTRPRAKIGHGALNWRSLEGSGLFFPWPSSSDSLDSSGREEFERETSWICPTIQSTSKPLVEYMVRSIKRHGSVHQVLGASGKVTCLVQLTTIRSGPKLFNMGPESWLFKCDPFTFSTNIPKASSEN